MSLFTINNLAGNVGSAGVTRRVFAVASSVRSIKSRLNSALRPPDKSTWVGGEPTPHTNSSAIWNRRIAWRRGLQPILLECLRDPLSIPPSRKALMPRGATACCCAGATVRVRTRSGAVDLGLTGNGDVDVETGSSAIRLPGVHGSLTAVTESGRVSVEGGRVARRRCPRDQAAWTCRVWCGRSQSTQRAVPAR